MNDITFSYKAKDEASRIYPEKECCKRAELSALLRMEGTVTLGFGGTAGFYADTEYSSVARLIHSLLKDLYEMDSEITVLKTTKLKKQTIYRVIVEQSSQAFDILEELGIFNRDWTVPFEIKRFLVSSKCCKKAYVRGAFLGGGSITNPNLSYHLEIKVQDKTQAKELAKVINKFYDMEAKILERRTFWIVYIKDSQQIADFLAIIGAHQALLDFENVRALKSLKTKVTREVNCETANLQKTVDASHKQIEAIHLIQNTKGLDILGPEVAKFAKIRLNNPEANLIELGAMADPPIGKSGANHRMRRIMEIAKSIEEGR